ncbi:MULTISPECIES: hypothetical protein [unclassified Variovorax]|uniref:hypothetical protein n=1 Tax=unclassified Variovorax TaxID=663243 RepID=UPI00076DAF74|nr:MULTISPECIES: hypothetical protein [unclassified Variovorax]KWT73973.1 hypothetical protein APY03_5824 [Variovorax sp. WDL1]PNG52309.1 hypothetical protein CHC07_04681 [Variovorax sp. B4]PNG54849.1 hypothetical protein CHC06_03647 [Variovorax sp. B2]VTV15860.1 hypothetical protein WDL1CHR_06221 [Variovorax sp. WDL1]
MATANHPFWPLPVTMDQHFQRIERIEQLLTRRVDEAIAARAEYRRLLAAAAALRTVALGAEAQQTLGELIEARVARLIVDARPGSQS